MRSNVIVGLIFGWHTMARAIMGVIRRVHLFLLKVPIARPTIDELARRRIGSLARDAHGTTTGARTVSHKHGSRHADGWWPASDGTCYDVRHRAGALLFGPGHGPFGAGRGMPTSSTHAQPQCAPAANVCYSRLHLPVSTRLRACPTPSKFTRLRACPPPSQSRRHANRQSPTRALLLCRAHGHELACIRHHPLRRHLPPKPFSPSFAHGTV